MQAEDANGQSAFGFYKLTVAVNNQVLRLSSEEIRAYLSTLSVADIENGEIIRNPNKRGTGSDYRTSQTANEGISIEK